VFWVFVEFFAIIFFPFREFSPCFRLFHMLCEGLRVCKSLRGVLICQVNFFWVPGYQPWHLLGISRKCSEACKGVLQFALGGETEIC